MNGHRGPKSLASHSRHQAPSCLKEKNVVRCFVIRPHIFQSSLKMVSVDLNLPVEGHEGVTWYPFRHLDDYVPEQSQIIQTN